MFDYTILHWMTFLSAAVLLNLSPGPDIAFILGQTLRNGRRQGFAAMFGAWTGAGLHVVMAAVGLSAILAASALAFSIVKWLGAAYLIWLGIKMLLSRGDSFVTSESLNNQSQHSVYWQGVLVSALNPKVAIFFLAFLPQFVVEGAGSSGAQLFLHGSLIIVVAAFIEPPLVLAGARLGSLLKKNRQVGLWLDRGLGALFVTLGVRLAASTR
ncbi:LysE family translocator [Vibrio gazogenes]|uniref:Threonine/homoserine/homoserine lactone efflux protein n=1 Tax=Vibrio gazogenes DSM 21264 = NBRC 103151 TaxID=1123492 RepID=A0A1M4TYP5_VIBGA|nr:LysE family translocator [Vibrio gazogenes]USP16191.1 LysE family translocator [Vibrio gazogenes]SHE49618.1 Threonine/homoserine/homoserine lactone efflux protein [Vibrio gazogenes DSM 21264] [Vibrio gazogenes DSM 21264 = NBRC 103151]SJN53087.1 Leucine efflux protein [Vibrio gazogenes]